MSLMVKLRRGEGPFWGSLKRSILWVMRCHIPVAGILKPFFALLFILHVGVCRTLRWLVRFFWAEPLFRSQCTRIGAGFRMNHMPFLVGSGRIILGDHVHFGGKLGLTFGNRGAREPEIVIGDHTFVGHLVTLTASDSIKIGNHCLIASRVEISDYDGHPVDAERRRRGEPTPSDAIRPVVIGDDVWIGNNAVILKGVEIGDRSIVAACSVVTQTVPADVVVAGIPARIIKSLAPEFIAPSAVPHHAGEPA